MSGPGFRLETEDDHGPRPISCQRCREGPTRQSARGTARRAPGGLRRDAARARSRPHADFDPLDGGTSAQALFLFEKPGPKAACSGFISRNNNDQTAENTFRFMEQAGIPRKLTCIWNVIPGWNGSLKVTSEELRSGVASLPDLFELVPDLKVVMLVGRRAERAKPLLEGRGLPVLSSCHPSPKNYALAREKWLAIPSQWTQVQSYIA